MRHLIALLLFLTAFPLPGCRSARNVSENPYFAGDYAVGREYRLKHPACVMQIPREGWEETKRPSLLVFAFPPAQIGTAYPIWQLDAGTTMRFERLNLVKYEGWLAGSRLVPVAVLISGPMAGRYVDIQGISRRIVAPPESQFYGRRYFVDPVSLEAVEPSPSSQPALPISRISPPPGRGTAGYPAAVPP